jgi:hypothetical protein
MAHDFGTGVSRVLEAAQANMLQVIWQQGKPPLDAELNFLQQLADDWRRIGNLRGCPSGVLSNAVNGDEDFVTGSTWSNWFRVGQQKTSETQAILWACVNGWLVPVTGTGTGTPPGSPNDSDTWNKVTLDPPPSNSGDSRIDFVFLETWLARVPPNPSTTNKPSSSTLYRYGNVEGGYTYLADDIQDPAIGFETTQRVQLQYRIRVVSGLVGLTSYPDGFDPTVVKGRGAATADTSYTFENMRKELGDPGLWRAGDGTANSLGSVDGYTYAVPLCAVFRRNSVAWDGDPGQNLNGGFDRNPTAVDRTGTATFSATATMTGDITDADVALTLVSTTDIPLPLTPATGVFIQIDDEILQYSLITGTTMTLSGRGQLGTKAEPHLSGATITVLSGRPDSLFSDQIAKTDILDLRHAVNPNGFDYSALLKGNLDKLLRGELRAGWKRTGGGPQGPFVFHQDKISASAAALGVTLLDAPDGHRTVYSDAAMQQKMTFVATPPSAPGGSLTTSWSLSLTGTHTVQATPYKFSGGDVLTIPISQLKNSMPGTDSDQVQFIDDIGAVSIRVDGEKTPKLQVADFDVYTVTGPNDDLQIELLSFSADLNVKLIITFHVQWGPGRGISRRPDQVHSVSYLSANTDILIRQRGVPADNTPMYTAWTALWSKYRSETFHSLLPVTAGSYVDLGSKTVILTPFRRIELPAKLRVLDGTYANPNYSEITSSGTTGTSNGVVAFNDASATFQTDLVTAGDTLVITSPVIAAGEYIVQTIPLETQITVDRAIRTAASIVYTVVPNQGLMPINDVSGVLKWTTTDPLDLFSGSQSTDHSSRINLYLPLDRHMVPGWGEVRVPVLHTDTATFSEGINFLILTTKGQDTLKPDSEKNFIPFDNGGLSYAVFSTADLNTYPGPVSDATFNTKLTYSGISYAGVRQLTDARNLGRQGLQMPPFYGIARLFAVYEAEDYSVNLSTYDASTRDYLGTGATNLLRQDFDGPAFWIEIDDDGDSTFILNAEAIDITKSPNAIADFASGHYVIEASIFGFDRGSFDRSSFGTGKECRLVLATGRGDLEAGDPTTRVNNFGMGSDADINTPDEVIPAPAVTSDEIAINYSRTPYQGDAWGSQTAQQDIIHHQGPLLTSNVYQLISTELDEENLTRPNQKGLEVLASTGFITTMGTGRLSGDLPSETFDFRNVGYEDWSGGVPTSGSDPRPPLAISALGSYASDIGSSYHGCTERLPLGALFLDKDFRGDYIGGDSSSMIGAPFMFTNDYAPGILSSSIAADSSFEQSGVQVGTSTLSSGQPGEVVVHVDGEQGNYGLLVNFRVNRGGSGFSASAPRPGGEFAATFHTAGLGLTYGGVLTAVAYLVRNTVTAIGSTEVSAGGELMLLITTKTTQLDPGQGLPLSIFTGTNGTGESFCAVDLYRISGHPLETDHVRFDVDPVSIVLPKKTPYAE